MECEKLKGQLESMHLEYTVREIQRLRKRVRELEDKLACTNGDEG